MFIKKRLKYYKTCKKLLQNAAAFLLQYAVKFYYKTRQFYYKMRQVLQNASFITKRGITINITLQTSYDIVSKKSNVIHC